MTFSFYVYSIIYTGGAFMFPMAGFAASFWKYIQAELKSQNIDAGVAILHYGKYLPHWI